MLKSSKEQKLERKILKRTEQLYEFEASLQVGAHPFSKVKATSSDISKISKEITVQNQEQMYAEYQKSVQKKYAEILQVADLKQEYQALNIEEQESLKLIISKLIIVQKRVNENIGQTFGTKIPSISKISFLKEVIKCKSQSGSLTNDPNVISIILSLFSSKESEIELISFYKFLLEQDYLKITDLHYNQKALIYPSFFAYSNGKNNLGYYLHEVEHNSKVKLNILQRTDLANVEIILNGNLPNAIVEVFHYLRVNHQSLSYSTVHFILVKLAVWVKQIPIDDYLEGHILAILKFIENHYPVENEGILQKYYEMTKERLPRFKNSQEYKRVLEKNNFHI